MKQVIITGPKHSGKTCTGKALALLLACDFVDIDELILQKTGKTPRQLFSESPDVFKQAEAKALAALVRFLPTIDSLSVKRIIAAGGGIIDNPDALAVLKEVRGEKTSDGLGNTIVIYLNISADLAWSRITKGRGLLTRGMQTSGLQNFGSPSLDNVAELPPFLKTENPQETHRILHERRAAAYRQIADIIIEAEEKSSEQIVMEIKELVKF